MSGKIKKVYFISGHRNISQNEFDENYGKTFYNIERMLIDSPINKKDFPKYVVGDYYGVDIMAQNYLIDVLEIDPDRITVYHMFDAPRNKHPKIKNTKGGYNNDEERDAAMTNDSTDDIAFVRDHNKWSGTGANILRRKLLK